MMRYITLGLVLILGLLLFGRLSFLLDMQRANLISLSTLSSVSYQTNAKLILEQNENEERCEYALIDYHSLRESDMTVVERSKEIKRLATCLPEDRQILLVPIRVENLWELGLHSQVCDELLPFAAAGKLLELATRSLDNGDYIAVREYIDCLALINSQDTWISPYLVAKLYFALGENDVKYGRTELAITEFSLAASWYPVVWAAPHINKADLLWQQNKRQEAIEELIEALSRSTDVSASFYLWRKVASLWQTQGNMLDAHCALERAEALMEEVPSTDLPYQARLEFLNMLDNSRAQLSVNGDSCFSNYPLLCGDKACP